MESSALAGTAADRRATPSTTADAPPWLAAVVDAAAVCKRGLAANQVLDIKQPDLHVVLTVLLAASVRGGGERRGRRRRGEKERGRKRRKRTQHSALAMRAAASGAHRVWHDGCTPRTR